MSLPNSVVDGWKVFSLFLIPIGGGIPAGVLLAQNRGIAWPVTTLLYLVSDIVLAIVFEPIMKGISLVGKRFPLLNTMVEASKNSMKKSASRYGYNAGPLALIMISFGVDPMTGRAAASMASHGFLSGWALAITGDMMYFAVLMVCTLWLKDILGDGTAVMTIILGITLLGPPLLKKIRGRSLGNSL